MDGGNFFYGRLANLWDCEANGNENNIAGPEGSGWSAKVVPTLWSFGLDLWKVRNELLQGDGPISIQAVERAKKLVEAVNREIALQVKGLPREWVFNNEEQTRQLVHQNQLAWLVKVKILFPREFKIVERNTVGKGQSESESAHHLKRN